MVLLFSQLPRSQVIKSLWAIIKERNLQDPTNKQFILCDDQFLKILGKPRIQMFKMTKELERHIYPLGKDAVIVKREDAPEGDDDGQDDGDGGDGEAGEPAGDDSAAPMEGIAP